MRGASTYRPSVARLILAVLAATATMSISSGAVALRLADISNLVPGDRVVCMFDSSEGSTENKNPLSGIVAESLARQGYRVEWLDVANGPPAPGIVAGARAVVTGFKDGKIGRARDLVEFLREVANAGVRVVVIGAFGAFQDSDGAFLPANVVNRFFLAIGVNYEAWWTDEPAKFSVRVEDQALGLPQAVTSSATRHFYQFSSMRPDVHVQVSGQRTDSELPPSALVFTSATGAMALSRYLSGDDMLADARQSRLDINAFVSEALGRRPADPTTLLVVVDPTVSDSRRALESIRQAASYCGIPLATMTVGAASTLRPIDLAAYAGLVLAVPEVPAPLDDYLAGLVKDLLSRKGRALSVLPVRNKPLAVVFGHDGSAPPVPYKASKVRFTAAAFPGLGGFLIDLPEPSLSGLRAALPSRCTVMVHAVVSDGEVPMWWRCPVGGGEVSVLNAYELTDRASLGFVIQALLDVEGSFAMPVLDAAVEFVDDCPLPMTGSVLPVLGKLDTTFYRDDFYGAVRDLAKRLGIRPTFLAVFTYDDKVSAPYGEPWPGPTGEVSRELASRIVADDFPAGLHGMTHVSPGLSGGVTRPFADESALMNQLQAARHAYSQVFGAENFPIVYVPPNDWIDAAGKRALVAAVPEVRVLASVFVGSDVETQQDFGPDPDQPSLVALPRTWAGMTLAGDPAMGMVNGLLAQVTSTHFIHPDDVLDKERSGGLLWAGLRDSWIRSMDEMRRRFPYLREMTAVQAADEVRRMSATGLKVVASGQAGVSMTRASGIDGSMIVLVRLPAGCRASADAGGKVVLTDPASGRHLVRMDRRKLVVGCERGSAEPTRALAAR